MSTINQCISGAYAPEGMNQFFGVQIPEDYRRYKDPYPSNIDYCDTKTLSGWSFTTGNLVNVHDYYIYMASMPLWEEYQSRLWRAGLSKSTRSPGGKTSYSWYPSSSESGFRMDETYFFSGNRKLLYTNIETNFSGGQDNWTGMNLDTTKSLITGLSKANIISFNNEKSQHGDTTSKIVLGPSGPVDFPQTMEGSMLSMDPDGLTYFIHIDNDLKG